MTKKIWIIFIFDLSNCVLKKAMRRLRAVAGNIIICPKISNKIILTPKKN